MLHTKLFHAKRKAAGKRQRGVALITSLVLLLLMTGLITAMVFSLRSDLLVNGNYRNFRGSFYAADSGLNVVRRQMANLIIANAATGTVANNTQPITVATSTILQSLHTAYDSNVALSGSSTSGTTAASWPEAFKLDPANAPTLSLTSCTTQNGTNTSCTAPTGNPNIYTYVYSYTMSVIGAAQGTQQAAISDRGNFTIVANLTVSNSTTQSFAAWGTFLDQYASCSAGFGYGTLTGPFFTNGSWNFGTGGSYLFTDAVGQHGSQASYDYSDGTCDQSSAASDSHSGVTIAPTFNNGFSTSQSQVPLPSNSYNQLQAVIDGQGTTSGSITNGACGACASLHASVKNISQTAYPTAGTSSGVYLPYTVDPITHLASFNGGGIYVEGATDSVQLSPSNAASGKAQIYTIKQGGTTTTITIDPGTSLIPATTTMTDNLGHSLNISGVPMNLAASPATPAASLYVNGNINSLSGPGEGQAAIQDGTALTITSAGNVILTGDVLYKTKPVTTAPNQIGTLPADSLIPGNDKGQVLGIFTATGQIQINTAQASGNLEVDASLAMISSGGSGGLKVTSNMNNVTIMGGRIANQPISGSSFNKRDIWFDRRFGGNFSPPFFPSTTFATTPKDVVAPPTASFQRVQWLYKANTY